jgi:hypothetical protein
MDSSAFLRIERDHPAGAGARHYVMHLQDPRFSLELVPDAAAPDGKGRGVMKRLCVPNSWAGDYTRYGCLIAAAQDFFAQSCQEPAPVAGARRPGR